MSTYRIEARSGSLGSLDRAVLGRTLRFVRRAEDLFVEAADVSDAVFERDMALHGVRVEVATAPSPDPRWRPSVGVSLAPLPRRADLVDLVSLTPVDLGTASRGLAMAGAIARILGRRGLAAARCRALLRGDDALFRWERRAWLSADACRDRRIRQVVRPVVFDREALRVGRPGGMVLMSAGALARWATG